MKTKILPDLLTAAFLAFLLAFGGIRCITTAFDLEISLKILILSCLVFAMAGCLLFTRPRGGWTVLALLAVLGIYLWRKTTLTDQLLQLTYRITKTYTAYGFGWLGRPMGLDSVALPLYLWAGLNALTVGFCVIRRRFAAPAIVVSLLPLVLCLVVTDTTPGVGGLFALLLGLILLLMTQGVRRRDGDQAVRLTRLLAVPVPLALALLFLANPQGTYDKQHYADRLGDALLRVVERLPYVDISADGSMDFSLVRHIPGSVDLQSKGVNRQRAIPVMEVTGESGGPLYLRGRDYDTYTGIQWNATAGRSETFTALHGNTVNDCGVKPLAMGSLTVKTSGARSSRYLPYYPELMYPLQGGACGNPGGEISYSYNWYALPGNFGAAAGAVTVDVFSGSTTYADYLQLPEATRRWAETYLEDHLTVGLSDAGICDLANAIAGLVRDSADYSLDTRRMPEGTEDFARWFLEESDTGYCVHYATATTVLLRAAGIPARYVEGYLTEAVPAETVTVTEKDGHAWAEYYLPGIGWIPLESTAAISVDRPIITAPETTTAEATTVPPTTEPPESTTEPSESTTIPGTDATDPSKIPVEPTDATAGTPGPNPTEPSEPAQLMPGEEKSFTISKPVLIVICLLLLLLGQYPIRLRLREHHLRTGTPNSRGLKNWRFVCRLARLAGQTPPEELHELALRARFSPYTLTEEDLARFDGFRSQLTAQLRRRPWWQKLWHRLFRAAY